MIKNLFYRENRLDIRRMTRETILINLLINVLFRD